MENTLTWGEEYSQLKGLPTVQGYIRNNTFLSCGGWSEWWASPMKKSKGAIIQERTSSFSVKCPRQGLITVVYK